jgi:hypothetical protein
VLRLELLEDPHQVVLQVAEEVLVAEALLESQRESGEGNRENHQRHD